MQWQRLPPPKTIDMNATNSPKTQKEGEREGEIVPVQVLLHISRVLLYGRSVGEQDLVRLSLTWTEDSCAFAFRIGSLT